MPNKTITCQNCSAVFTGWHNTKFCSACKHEKDKVCKRRNMNERYASDPEFRKRSNEASRQYQKNNPRFALYKQDYHIRNREHINERSRRWRRENPEMVAANNAKLRMREPLDPEVVKTVFARDEYQCVYCSSTDQLSLDHLHPVSRGGCNEAWNLAVACKSCNSSKHDKTPAEFFWYQGKIREHQGPWLA